MQLPSKITPCPIADTTIEVVFETAFPEEAVIGVVYQALQKDFPKMTALPLASFPADVRKADPHLRSQPLYKIEGDRMQLMLGPGLIGLTYIGEYPGWKTFSKDLLATFDQITRTGLVTKPVRFGLRYINFFEGNVLPRLTLSLQIAGDEVNGEGTSFSTLFARDGMKQRLKIGKDLKLAGKGSAGSKGKVGSIIDIDTFQTAPDLTLECNKALSNFMEAAHLSEKELFFTLLKPDFLTSLNPTYSDDL